MYSYCPGMSSFLYLDAAHREGQEREAGGGLEIPLSSEVLCRIKEIVNCHSWDKFIPAAP